MSMGNILSRMMLAVGSALVISASLVSSAAANPPGWSFSCHGTTGVYTGTNGSYVIVEEHFQCVPR
jgi:hypothetical protein